MTMPLSERHDTLRFPEFAPSNSGILLKLFSPIVEYTLLTLAIFLIRFYFLHSSKSRVSELNQT